MKYFVVAETLSNISNEDLSDCVLAFDYKVPLQGALTTKKQLCPTESNLWKMEHFSANTTQMQEIHTSYSKIHRDAFA